MALVTLAEAKAQVGIPAGVATHDAVLQPFVDALDSVLERHTGPLTTRSVVEKHDGGPPALVLREWPVVSVESVTVDGTAVAAADYDLDTDEGLLYHEDGSWPGGRRKVEVTYTAGRSTIPPAAKAAALVLVEHWWTMSHAGSPLHGLADADGLSLSPDTRFGVPYRVLDMLRPVFRPPAL